MNPEQNIQPNSIDSPCPEQLGMLALQGYNAAVRGLLALPRAISGMFVEIYCETHNQKHRILVAAFVLDRGGLL